MEFTTNLSGSKINKKKFFFLKIFENPVTNFFQLSHTPFSLLKYARSVQNIFRNSTAELRQAHRVLRRKSQPRRSRQHVPVGL